MSWKPKREVSVGGTFNFGHNSQAIGNVEGENYLTRGEQPQQEETQTHHEFKSSFTGYSDGVPPPPYPPPAPAPYPAYGYPPPYHHPSPYAWNNEEEMVATAVRKATRVAAEAAAAVGQKPVPPKTEGQPTKPTVALPADPPTAATTCQQQPPPVVAAAADPPPPAAQPPRKEPPAADGYRGLDVAGHGYPVPVPPYGSGGGYPPRHGGYYEGGGYSVQGYPTHHGHGGGYYGYGAPPPHYGYVQESYHRYRQPGRPGGYGTYGGYGQHQGGYGHYQGGYGGYGHHGKFKQGHHGKYSHYYGPHRGGKFAAAS